MDLTPNSIEHFPEKIEDVKERGPTFHCNLFDTEIVHKVAQAFLPGLATACVDNTTGDMFRSPASVAVDIRKEMIDYLTQRSESFVAESMILEDGTETSDHPFDNISDFIDDFSSSKMNFLSRVSGWLLSEKREDKIDDFVQEMELTGFWSIERRESIAQTLVKNVDFKDLFHCNMKFKNVHDLDEHVLQCGFRLMNCTNEGCNGNFVAAQLEKHDSNCPFKILPCEQKCSMRMMRREMDRHCITVCPMKLMNCPFYSIGCQTGIPQSMNVQHRIDNLDSHLLYVLQAIHKDVSLEDLKQWAGQLQESSSSTNLAEARDVRALMSMVKDLENKLGGFKIKITNKDDHDDDPNSIQHKLDQIAI